KPGRHVVILAQVVIQARPAVAAEMARRELALISPNDVLALGKPEVVLGHDYPGQARSGPPLAARAVTVTHRLRVPNLVRPATRPHRQAPLSVSDILPPWDSHRFRRAWARGRPRYYDRPAQSVATGLVPECMKHARGLAGYRERDAPTWQLARTRALRAVTGS